MSAALSLNVNMTNCLIGSIFTDEYLFDVQLVDGTVRQLKFGKAAGFDNLTAEHLYTVIQLSMLV